VLALAVLGTSSGAVLVRLAESPAPVTAFWRLAFSVIVLTPFLLIGGGWRSWKSLHGRDALLLLLSGFCLAAHFLAWFRSLDFTSVASSTVLVSSHPLFVGLLSARLLGERPSRAEWLGITMAVTGALVIGWGDFLAGPDPLLGDALALLAAAFGAAYLVVGRRLRATLDLLPYVIPVYAIAALICLVRAVAGGMQITGWPAGTWWALAGLAIGPTILGHTGLNWALRHVRAYVVSVVLLSEPLGATLLAVLVLGRSELPGWNTLIGGAAILTGVWLSIKARVAVEEPLRPVESTGGAS
jgi:drug/metabolite transporter (DMT)-like permease